MKNIRKWSRILHRDIGFFFIGTTLIYAISGIALNHMADWNPNYSVEVDNFTTSLNLEKNDSTKENIFVLLDKIDNRNNYKSHYYPNDNNIKIFAKKVSKDFILLSSLNYDRKTNLYKKGDKILNDDFYRNRFAYSKLSIDAFRNNNRSGLLSAFNFFISDFNEMSENQIHFSALLNKRIKNQFYKLDISFDNYLNYNNSNSRFQSLDYKIVSFLPSTVFKIKGFNLYLSADLDLLLNDKRIELYPEFKLCKELVENVLYIDAGLRHIKKRNTYKSLTDQNPFVHSFGTNQSIFMQNYFLQDLKNSDTYEVYFFLKNKLSSNETLQFESSYGNISEFSQFTLFDNRHYERFKVDYLRSVNQFYFSASYEYLINRIL